MERLQFMVMRLSGLFLMLLVFGRGVVLSVQNYGERYSTQSSGGALVFLAVFGSFMIGSVWLASQFAYANQLAIGMVVYLLIGFVLRQVTDHVSLINVVYYALFIVLGFILALGRGKAIEDMPILKWRRRSETRGLPRLNRRRAKQGKSPVESFQQVRDEIPPEEKRRQKLATIFSLPLILLVFQSMLHDIGHQGEHQDIQQLPAAGIVLFSVAFAGFCAGAWLFSKFKYRSVVLGVELVIIIVSAVGYFVGSASRTVNPWTIVGDVFWIALCFLQLSGKGRKA